MFSPVSRAWHSWMNAKGVAALAAIAFAVGIGSATAIYTVVNGVMLKPLPYPDADRWGALYGARFSEPGQRSAHTFPDLLEYQQRSRSFDVFGWFRPLSFNMSYAGQPYHIDGLAVTPSLAHNIGVHPIVGRWFADDRGAVISNALWRRLGSDPNIVGKSLLLDGRDFTVTGVMSSAFRLPVSGPGVGQMKSDLWIALDPLGRGENPSQGSFFSYARVKPGVTLPEAEADVKRVATEIAALAPASHPSYTAKLDGLRETVLLEIKPTLLLLVFAAGLLLLITSADVAGLLLARSIARARETAIRVALGASRLQLALHYFLEGLIVSIVGAAAGVLVSVLLVRLVLSIAASYIPRADDIAIDWTVALFAIGVAVGSSALASLAPLWQAVRTVPADVLNDGVRATAGLRSRRLSRALVIAEISLALTLLAAGAVLIAHLRNLSRVSPGFNPDGLLTFQLTTPDQHDSNDQKRAQYQKRFVSAIEGIAGVTGVTFTNQLPLDGCCLATTIYPEGRPEDLNSVQRVAFLPITPGYFRTLEIPLRAGRFLDERDVSEDPLFVGINEAAARFYWPGQNAVGAYGHIGGPQGSRFQVVGVAGDVRNDSLGTVTVPEIYLSSALLNVNPMTFLVRSSLPPNVLVPEIRRAIQGIDPALPIHDVAMMRDIVRESMSLERVGSFMVTFFALAALLMASLGVYGIVSYAVRQGTVEIGTRMALGAIARDLLLMILGDGLKMFAYGAAIGGVAVAIAVWILVRAFEIHDLGPLPFITSTAIVGVVAVVASFFPAWRATHLSPMVAIRNQPGSMWQSTRQSLRQTLTGVSRALSLSDDRLPAPNIDLITELVAAARGAGSFTEAFQRAIFTLRERIGATSAVLLENVSGELRRVVAVPDAESVRVLPADGFLVNRLQFYSYPLPFSSDDLESWRRWARERSPEYADEIQSLLDAGVRMAVPLRAKNEMIGVLLLGAPSSGAGYSDAGKQLLRQCAEQLTLMIENARLTSRVVEQEKLRRDLALAAEVQKRLLPDEPPRRQGAVFEGTSFPARSVGGDYYDFLDLGDQRIGIALADVAGKGVAAALIMAVVQASLRIVAADGETSLPELAAKINTFLHRSTGSNSYATFFYAQLDERSRQLRYVNAGHLPPYLLRTSGGSTAEIRELAIGGTVLGLFPQMSYEEATIDLQSGDVLVAFTDGVTEALNVTEEEFGEQRLKELLGSIIHLPAAEISARLSQELRTWIKDTTQYDDLTFIVMKVN
jgi:predicted permease